MKTLFLTLAVLLSLPAVAADCRVPGVPKIIGKDYHHARADLIVAGFRPAFQPQPVDAAPVEFAIQAAFGYLETSGCGATGSASCVFHFTGPVSLRVLAVGCEDAHGSPCSVRSVTCR